MLRDRCARLVRDAAAIGARWCEIARDAARSVRDGVRSVRDGATRSVMVARFVRDGVRSARDAARSVPDAARSVRDATVIGARWCVIVRD